MYSDDVLDMTVGFRFPILEVLEAMKSIIAPKENDCRFCQGAGWVLKLGNKSFCHPCQGSGIRGGYGRAYGRVPSAVFECPRTELL